MRKVMSGFLFLFVILIFSSCSIFSTRFKDGIVDVNYFSGRSNIQENKVRELASSSKDIIEFASKIYSAPPKESSAEHVLLYKVNTKSSSDFNVWDTDLFKIFCNEKKGNLYTLSMKYHYKFNSKLLACERNNDVDSVLLYEYERSLNTGFPYLLSARFGTKTYFQEYIIKRKLNFKSSNGIITIPYDRVHFPSVPYQWVSEKYRFSIDLKNSEKKPIKIDLLNSYVLINDFKYDLVFKSPKLSKLHLNPGQEIHEIIEFEIPGLAMIKSENMKDFVFQLDSIRCDKFTQINHYDLGKSNRLAHLYRPW